MEDCFRFSGGKEVDRPFDVPESSRWLRLDVRLSAKGSLSLSLPRSLSFPFPPLVHRERLQPPESLSLEVFRRWSLALVARKRLIVPNVSISSVEKLIREKVDAVEMGVLGSDSVYWSEGEDEVLRNGANLAVHFDFDFGLLVERRLAVGVAVMVLHVPLSESLDTNRSRSDDESGVSRLVGVCGLVLVWLLSLSWKQGVALRPLSASEAVSGSMNSASTGT